MISGSMYSMNTDPGMIRGSKECIAQPNSTPMNTDGGSKNHKAGSFISKTLFVRGGI